MNKRQLIVIWVGVGLICLMLLVPPYKKTGWPYYPIMVTPRWTVGDSSGYHRVNWPTLWVQLTVVALLTGVGVFTLKARK